MKNRTGTFTRRVMQAMARQRRGLAGIKSGRNSAHRTIPTGVSAREAFGAGTRLMRPALIQRPRHG